MSVFSDPWEEEVDRLEDELAAARKRIVELESSLAKEKAHILSLENDLMKSTASIAKLEERVKTLKALDDCPECDAKGDEPCLSGFHPSGFISPGTKYCNARLLQRAERQ